MTHTVIDTETLTNLLEIAHRYDELFGDQIRQDVKEFDKKSVNLAKVCLQESYHKIIAVGYNSKNELQSERFNVTHDEAMELLNLEKGRVHISKLKSLKTSRLEKLNIP